METKLTLRLNDHVIERAKVYARDHKISLSKLIESYLDRVTGQKVRRTKRRLLPLVENFSGVVDLPADSDYKKEYGEYLAEKYK
ncbi:MAG: DUF6364 family protein [Cyclobacteriaceae bacterium]|nr:DUF6364 family protein [Cyclobacteriaceae bacterium]